MAEQNKTVKKDHATCPYCDAEILAASFPFCQACKVKVFYCPSCKESIPKDSKKCPKCGADIKAGK